MIIDDADASAELLAGFLEERFSDLWLRRICSSQATAANVSLAFQDLAAVIREGDLLVVLFVGHGVPSDDAAHAYQAWALLDGELSDRQLADQLRQLPARVDAVVINDCCYGGGMFRVGPSLAPTVPILTHSCPLMARLLLRCGISMSPTLMIPLRVQLGALASAWRVRLHGNLAGQSPDMIAISAASRGRIVTTSKVKQLVQDTIDFARAGRTYGDLADHFDLVAQPGQAFEVASRPSHRICTGILV